MNRLYFFMKEDVGAGDIEQRTMSVTVQAAKLSGRVLKAAIAGRASKDGA